MKTVADKLAELAIGEKNENTADAFGRSAFNRYYYASYLVTRQMLKDLNTSWASTGHSKIPELLENRIIKRIRTEIKNQNRAGLIPHNEAERLKYISISAISELTNVLRTAYSARVTADYNPEIRVVRDGHNMKLRDDTLDSAQKWVKRVSQFTKSLLKVWSHLGLS